MKNKNESNYLIIYANFKVNRHIGGGVKFDYFMVDVRRHGPTIPNETYDERVGL
jgi:hypothetical protein